MSQEPGVQASNADESDQTATLENLLVHLSEDSYRMVHLHSPEGMSTREIPATLSIAEGTVKPRLFYARKKLQELAAGEKGENHA